jgi:hypothetical protein
MFDTQQSLYYILKPESIPSPGYFPGISLTNTRFLIDDIYRILHTLQFVNHKDDTKTDINLQSRD